MLLKLGHLKTPGLRRPESPSQRCVKWPSLRNTNVGEARLLLSVVCSCRTRRRYSSPPPPKELSRTTEEPRPAQGWDLKSKASEDKRAEEEETDRASFLWVWVALLCCLSNLWQNLKRPPPLLETCVCQGGEKGDTAGIKKKTTAVRGAGGEIHPRVGKQAHPPPSTRSLGPLL